MKAIILAAGRPNFTSEPISNLYLEGQSLLDIQVSCLRDGSVQDIVLITGHAASEVRRADIEIRVNRDWEGAGSLHSLALACDVLDGSDDVLLLYGDTLFEPWAIRSLDEAGHAIGALCLVERSNRDLELYREFAQIENGELQRVGPAPEGHALRTVFTGMCLVRRNKAAAVAGYLQELASLDRSLHLGALFNLLLRRGLDIGAVLVERGWAELSSEAGYREALKDCILLERVIQIHVDWDQRAKRYDKLDWVNDDALLAAMVKVAREVNPRRVLDVGTGSGKVLLGLRDAQGQGEFWGLDSSQAMLDRIPSRENLTLRIGDAETLEGIPDAHFDLVTARMVFHHVSDTLRAARSVRRVLNEGGCFALCEGVPPSLRTVNWYTEMFRFKEDRKTLTEVDLINLMVSAGFSGVYTRTIIMRNASLNNWIDNSGIPQQNIDIVKQMHHDAPAHVRDDYEMRFENGDCLMTWRFALTVGCKR